MSYRAVPRKAVRYTEATRPDQVRTAAPASRLRTTEQPLSDLSYRDLQQRAILLGINGRQTREDLEAAILEAEK